MKIWLRALLAVGLLVGFIVLSTLMLVVLVATLGWALVTRSLMAYPVGLVAIPVIFGIGYGLVALVRHRRAGTSGVVVGRQDQPELWRLVLAVADRIETRPPDEIRLVADANAAVSEDSRWLGLVTGERRLFVGVPLLQCLTLRELEWVLAHEMGHYSDRHTALGPIAYRGLEAVSEMVTALGPRTLAGRFFGWYGRLYSTLTHSMSRRQELDADRWAADLVGNAVGISALREVEVASVAFGRFIFDYAAVAEPLAMRPAGFFAGFDALCGAEGRAADWEHVRTVLPAQPSSPYDTHPTTALRIEQLGRQDEHEPDTCVPARTILTDFDAVAASVEAELFATTGHVAVPWSVAVGQGWARRTEERAVWAMRVFDGLGGGRADLGEALFMVAHGGGDDLADAIIGADASAEARSAAVRDVLVVLVCAALLTTGSARYELCWDRPDVLLDQGGVEIDVAGLVDGVPGDHSAAEWLLELLREEGVSRTWRPGLSLAQAGPTGPEVHAVAVGRPGWRGRYPVLYISDAGLGVRNIGFREWVGVHPLGLRKAPRDLLVHAGQITDTRLVTDPRVRITPWADVETVRLVQGTSPRVVVRSPGRRVDVRVFPDGLAGDLFGALARFNQGRMTLT